MLKKIFGTAGAKLLHALLSLIIVLLNARVLGSEGVGTIALIVIGITIILLINNFIGGSALVYLIPKNNLFSILVISYSWAFISSVGVSFSLQALSLIPSEYFMDILLLSVLHSLGQINLVVLLAKENIKVHNYITVAQITIIFSTVLVNYYILNNQTIDAYISAMYLGYGATFFASAFGAMSKLKINKIQSLLKLIGQVLKYGVFVQFASISQLLNYRLSYYIIESYFGKAPVGVFDVGNKLSEGLWLPAKSISMVQYAKIANTSDKKYSIELSLNFLKFVFVATTLLIILLNLIPTSFFEYIKPEFGEVSLVILYLSPGILFLALKMIIVHYFSGTGKHYLNTISSVLGLITTVIVGFTVIPEHGIIGAAITASASYFTSFMFQLISFIFVTKSKFSDFLLKKGDFVVLKNELKRTIKKRKA